MKPATLNCTALCLLLLAHAAAAATPNENWHAVAAPDGVQRVTIQCGADFIDPRQIVVRANRPVELTIFSPKTTTAQSFVMRYPGADINRPLTSNATKVAFRAGAPGRFAMDCQRGPGPAGDPQLVSARRGQLTIAP